MNKKLECIFKRRSVRRYTNEDVPDDLIKDILSAGMSAPSAVAKDPWEFIVVKDKRSLEKITEGLPNGQMLPSAAVGIVVCGDISRAHTNALSYLIQDCAAAIENILLAASILGLGSVWLGVHPREDRVAYIANFFKLPENILPIAVLSIGWPADPVEARTRYNARRVHREKWS